MYQVLALLQVYTEAYTKCTLKVGTDATAGGCALATSFAASLAEACGRATADAFASADAKECDCDIGALADAQAWAAEYAAIFARVEQQARRLQM